MKKAIIIGASSGLGKEVSKLLLADGWKLGIAARREDKLLEIKALNPEMVETEVIDVCADGAEKLMFGLVDRIGGVDLLFYASGIGKQDPVLDFDIEMETMEINGKGFIRMVSSMFNYMAENGGGHIAIISSAAATKGLGSAPAYSATKRFQANYMQALEQQVYARKLPIHLTEFRPGFVDTPLLNKNLKYPMMMSVEKVAKDMVQSIYKRRHVRIIDWKFRILLAFWSLIPNALWRRMDIRNKANHSASM